MIFSKIFLGGDFLGKYDIIVRSDDGKVILPIRFDNEEDRKFVLEVFSSFSGILRELKKEVAGEKEVIYASIIPVIEKREIPFAFFNNRFCLKVEKLKDKDGYCYRFSVRILNE